MMDLKSRRYDDKKGRPIVALLLRLRFCDGWHVNRVTVNGQGRFVHSFGQSRVREHRSGQVFGA